MLVNAMYDDHDHVKAADTLLDHCPSLDRIREIKDNGGSTPDAWFHWRRHVAMWTCGVLEDQRIGARARGKINWSVCSFQPRTDARKHYDELVKLQLQACDLMERRAREMGVTQVNATVPGQYDEGPCDLPIEEYLRLARKELQHQLDWPFSFWINQVYGLEDVEAHKSPSAIMDPLIYTVLTRLKKGQRAIVSVLARQLGGLHENEESLAFSDSVPLWWVQDKRSRDNPLPAWLGQLDALGRILESSEGMSAAPWAWLGVNAVEALNVPPRGVLEDVLEGDDRLMAGDLMRNTFIPQIADSLEYAKKDVQAWLDELANKECVAGVGAMAAGNTARRDVAASASEPTPLCRNEKRRPVDMTARSAALHELVERASSLAKHCPKVDIEPGAPCVVQSEKGKVFCRQVALWTEDILRNTEFGQIARDRMSWSGRQMKSGEAGRLYRELHRLLCEGNAMVEERESLMHSPPEADPDEIAAWLQEGVDRMRAKALADHLADPFDHLLGVNQEGICDAAIEPFGRRLVTALADAQFKLYRALNGMRIFGVLKFDEMRRYLAIDRTAIGSARTEWQRLIQDFERVWIGPEAIQAAPWTWLGSYRKLADECADGVELAIPLPWFGATILAYRNPPDYSLFCSVGRNRLERLREEILDRSEKNRDASFFESVRDALLFFAASDYVAR